MNIALWVLQVLLMVAFLFVGGIKLVLPDDQITDPSIPIPVLFTRFIGVCEVLGGLGLVLPGLFRIRTGLTPLAAAGLLIILAGAVVINATMLPPDMRWVALIPFVFGVLVAIVGYARWRVIPHRKRG
jgi:uncharacterized membrane protein